MDHLIFVWNHELCCDHSVLENFQQDQTWISLTNTLPRCNSPKPSNGWTENASRRCSEDMKSFPQDNCHSRSLCFDNCAFLPNSCFGSRGKIIKYLWCQKVNLLDRAFSVNQMFPPTNFPFITQPDSSCSTFGLIHAESSLPFWLLPSSLSNYRGTKLITIIIKEQNRKGQLSSVQKKGRNPSQLQMFCRAGARSSRCLSGPVGTCGGVFKDG